MDNLEEDNEEVEFLHEDDALENADIIDLLPKKWKTVVIKVDGRGPKRKFKILVAIKTEEEVKLWLKLMQEITKATYYIRATKIGEGRYMNFKQRLHCHRNQRSQRVSTPNSTRRIRNTNCTSTIIVTIKAVKPFHTNRIEENIPNRALPCQIVFSPYHNHSMDTPENLRFRPVSEETTKKLTTYFKKGYSPSAALERLKKQLVEDNPDCTRLLMDRRFCPDYRYCYYLHRKLTKNKKRREKEKIEEEKPQEISFVSNEINVDEFEFNSCAEIELLEVFEATTNAEDFLTSI